MSPDEYEDPAVLYDAISTHEKVAHKCYDFIMFKRSCIKD